jgi:hypothetical protein
MNGQERKRAPRPDRRFFVSSTSSDSRCSRSHKICPNLLKITIHTTPEFLQCGPGSSLPISNFEGRQGRRLCTYKMADGRFIGVPTRLPVCNGDMGWSTTCLLGKLVSAVLGFPWGERRVAPDSWVRVGNATKRNSSTEAMFEPVIREKTT